MGRYGTDHFFVKDANKKDVAAKYLKDANGDYIMNRSTGRPYVVPADFNLDAVIAKYEVDPRTLPDLETSMQARGASYAKLYENFQRGRPDDLQRSYNGKVDATWVKDFQPAASYVFGAACAAAGLPLWQCKAGGGGYNLGTKIFGDGPKNKTSGEFGNNPDNVQHIEQGYRSQTSPDAPKTTGKYVPVEGGGIDAAVKAGIYAVEPGNVLGDIAAKFHTTVQKIMEANPDIKNPDSIRPGQRIVLPKDDPSGPADNKKDPDPDRQGATDKGTINSQHSQSIIHDGGFTQIASSAGPDVSDNTAASAPADDAPAGFPDAPLRHALDALGVKPRDVQFTPAEADDEKETPDSFDIRDNDTAEKIGSYAGTPTGCEMTVGDRKVVMDRMSGNDIHLQTYAKNDDGDFELVGTTRIGDNDGITVRRPFAA